jgi:type IV pilus assembly protein PilA
LSTFCAACGSVVNEGENFCRRCGAAVAPGVQFAATGAPAAAAQTSGKAITSLLFGLFIFFFPFSIVAIILGHLSLSEIRRSAGRLKGDGMAMAGLVLGYLGVAGVPVMLIVAAIAIPNLLRARMAANESSAVEALRTIMAAETNYSASHPQTGYTCAMSDLGAEHLIDSKLASGPKNGYAFELMACSPGPDGSGNRTYQVVAYPVAVNQNGVRAFCGDESGLIRVDEKGSPQNCLQSGQPLQ